MVGNGNNIRFLDDCWFGDQPLKLWFPSLHSTALELFAMVHDVLAIHNENYSWNIFLRGVYRIENWMITCYF